MVKEIESKDFEEVVLKSDGKVLVDFYANWCGPCKMLRPVLEEVASERSESKIVSINVDEAEELSSKYGIISIPCLILFENGKEIDRSIGLKSKSDIEGMIN
ncbi:MAG: thioredoxin [Bacilli bacterium]|nr:thioredoxin [Bacilli bacterium]